MDLTSQVSTPPQRLQSGIPSQAHELLEVERRESSRVEKEEESARSKELMLERECAADLKKKEEALATKAMQSLQEFKQHDLTDYLKKEGSETQHQAEKVQSAGLSRVNTVAETLVTAVLSDEILSRL